MCQGPLCPNLTKKVQKEVSQMANRKLSCAMLYRWFKCKLKPPKNYSIGHKSETDRPKQKKKIVFWRIYFYTFMLVLGLKFKIQMAENLCVTFSTSVKLTLNGPPNGPEVTYSKIQNRLRRAP